MAHFIFQCDKSLSRQSITLQEFWALSFNSFLGFQWYAFIPPPPLFLSPFRSLELINASLFLISRQTFLGGRSQRFSDFSGDKPFVCDLCGGHYKSRMSMYNHKRYYCGQAKSQLCPYCSYKCILRGNLKSHVKAMHPDVAPIWLTHQISRHFLYISTSTTLWPQFRLSYLVILENYNLSEYI